MNELNETPMKNPAIDTNTGKGFEESKKRTTKVVRRKMPVNRTFVTVDS
jgi:hypothetical protein